MSNQMPIYSQVVPKMQYKSKSKNGNGRESNRNNMTRPDFDPLNYNHGGNFHVATDNRLDKDKRDEKTDRREEKLDKRDERPAREDRREERPDRRDERQERRDDRPDRQGRRTKDETSKSRRAQIRNEATESKVEAYLKQNQISMRQQQYRHSAVRQAEHRVNLRSLPLNDVAMSKPHHDKTPTDRHRGFPERDRDGVREHRRERERDRDRDRDRDNCEFDIGSPLSPHAPRHEKDSSRPIVRKSSSAHKMADTTISLDKRRFFCREWAFQRIAHCLEQRPASKTCGALILGDAGCGKTALCQELSEPGGGAQARQQRALNRRLLARYFVQGDNESTLRPGEFVRSLAMQILSHSSRRTRQNASGETTHVSERKSDKRRNSDEDNLVRRFRDLGDDVEECSRPLLADSEDQRTDEEDACPSRRQRTIDRIHEREAYLDAMIDDAELITLPEIMPRTNKATNPFLTNDDFNDDNERIGDFRLYENHENVFLRNVSQRQSKEIRNSKIIRQNSEPSNEKRPSILQKSLSTDQDSDRSKPESSPPKSRIPLSNFKYPNKNELRPSSNENSPSKSKTEQSSDQPIETSDLNMEQAEYQNVLKPTTQVLDKEDDVDEREVKTPDLERLLEKKRSQSDDRPPPIPSLPVSPRTLIANSYYDKLLSDTEIQQALLPQNLEMNPDECFKKALLFPLLEIDPPKQCLFLLVDAVDEGYSSVQTQESTEPSKTIAALVSRHQHLFPPWLLLVCTASRNNRPVTKMFTGFRKITLDELQRAHVSADVQRYVLARLDTEPRLRARVTSDSAAAAAAAAALDHLRIKSDGCLLYLEKVLDGVADGFIALREIREIPGTLNGLYLWLAQRLFHGRRFNKVRLLLDVLLAARCGVTEEMLYKCLLTKEYSVTRDEFNRRLHLLRRVLAMDRSTGYLSLFHRTFSLWLGDVKHCTRRYLCCAGEGHASLAMYYTLNAHRLSALEIHDYIYHMMCLEQYLKAQKKHKISENEVLDLHTLILLWILDSGCDIELALKRESDPMRQLDVSLIAEETIMDKEIDPDSDGKESVSLESIMPDLISGASSIWARDREVLATLKELTNQHEDGATVVVEVEDLINIEDQPTQEIVDSEVEEVVETPRLLDPVAIHEAAAAGDLTTLNALLKAYPSLASAVDASGSTALVSAARSGRALCCAALLAAGAPGDARDAAGWSALRAAAWAGHTDVVEVLLDFGCDVDAVDADNRTALRAAAWSGHEAVVSLLLALGASPSLADAEGRTPLIAAAYMAHQDIVRALIAAGATPDHADADGRTALSVAALCATGATVASILIEHGADVNKPDKDGATPLLVAAFEGHTDICELLLEAEADLEAMDSGGRSALWASACAGHAACARLLLFWGASVDNMDRDGRTVLTLAAAQGNVEVVRQLLDRGLDEHHRDNSGWTPLHYAAFEGHIEVCEALLEAGAKVDEADNDGKGPLMLAAQEGHTALVERLMMHAAPIEQRAHDGKTAFRLAALEGHFDTVRCLHALGADVDALDADRRSTLYVLALDNRLAMARYLLAECGASVHATDNEGRTPLHVSAWQGHTDMVRLLLQRGGAADARDAARRTPLHCAAWRGRAPAIRALLQHGADPQPVCTQGATPIGIAAQEGHEECVVWLLQHGADPTQADHCGRTPAMVAWRAGHANICRLLERWQQPSAPNAEDIASANSPEYKRRSVHSSNSTKSSSNLTGASGRSHEQDNDSKPIDQEKTSRTNLSLSFAQQVARCGRGQRRERERDNIIPEHNAMEKDPKLRSYLANERDKDIRGYACERDTKLDSRHGCERDCTSPLYVSPPRSENASPVMDKMSKGHPPSIQPATQPMMSDTHFNRDTHMRIILGRDSKQPQDRSESKSKRNGIVTNPAMRLMANVRNGLDNAAANIRRTGVALAASASSANPVVKTNAFQWRHETPL